MTEHYQPKVVMLTGGAGFIGSNTLVHLCLKYPAVTWVCYDKIDYCANVKNFQELNDKENFTFIRGDITNSNLVDYVILTHGVDTIMHFAAQTHVDNSFGNSFEFTKTNVLGTHTLLESAKKHQKQIRRFIHVSTDEVYGESQLNESRKTELDPMNPTNPYAATKAAAEFMVKSYRQSFDLPIIITRGNNVYGPKQYPEKLIPKFISLLSQGQPCPLHGDGTNRRSFLHVMDVARAFDAILHRGQVGETYNIGSENFEITNKGVLDILIKAFGYQEEADKYTRFVPDRAFNDFRYHIDSTSLTKLGWNRQIDFDVGIKTTKEWYMAHQGYWGDVSNALRAHPRMGSSLVADPSDEQKEPSAKRQKS